MLTTSPSPASSPRPIARNHIYSASPRQAPARSPLCNPSHSPSVRSYAAASSARLSEQPSQNRPPAPSAKVPYADAGTQYTPDGLPPTARTTTISDGIPRSAKRKESSPSPSMSTIPVAPPPEPDLRDTPAAVPEQELPERPATHNEGDNKTTTAGTPNASKRQRAGSDVVKVMPIKYETCNAKDLGVLIANMLMELIRLNDTIPLRDGKLTRFHSRAPPGISCHDYLLRLIQHATLSPPILLSMVYYIDRLCALYPAFTISSLTVHRFLITAATVASKGLSDSFWTNPTYARIGGISTSELATLEMDFLQRMQWKIVPKPETLVDYYNSLVQRSEGYILEVKSEDEEMDEEMATQDEPP